MAQTTKIEWTDQSWNFLRGCRRVSPGCENCYAERQAIRHAGLGGSYEGLVKSTPNGPRWTGKVSFHGDILLAPLKRRTPTKYFVNSMSDLFYEDVTDEMLDKAFAVMALCPQHIFQILTKRPERMKAYITNNLNDPGYWGPTISECAQSFFPIGRTFHQITWPFPNVWLGVSVENQEYADKRIPLLLDTPAAVRWISAEPLLGPIDLNRWLNIYWQCSGCKEFFSGQHQHVCPSCGRTEYWTGSHKFNGRHRPTTHPFWPNQNGSGLDWAVVGGESGPRSRPCDTANIRSIVQQFKSAGVPVFVKQLGAEAFDWRDDVPEAPPYEFKYGLSDRKGGKPEEWPEDLRVREYPT